MPKLELLASGPGTGKTTYCIDLFRKEILRSPAGIDSRAYFVLPNREHADRIQSLVLKKELPGLFNVHILTIQELASRLLGPSDKPRPGEALRRSILRHIVEDPAAKWEYFAPVTDLPGFYELLSERVQEFKSAQLGPEEFVRRAGGLSKDPVFGAKSRDFIELMKRYDAQLEARGLAETEDSIAALAQRPPKKTGSARLVLFDGFYHFSQAQKALLGAACRRSAHVVVTLTLPENSAKRAHVFELVEDTRRFLIRMGFERSLARLGSNRRVTEPVLTHLEKHLFTSEPVRLAPRRDALTVLSAETPHDEVESIASEIRRLHRETEWHFSDMAVILRDVGGYDKSIAAVFDEYEIPVNIHERKKTLESGFGRFIHRFLSLPLSDWQGTDILPLLKSGFCPGTPDVEAVSRVERLAFERNVLSGRENWLKLSEEPGCAGAKKAVEWFVEAEKDLLIASSARSFRLRFAALARRCRLEGADQPALDALEGLLLRAESTEKGRVFSPKESLEEFRRAIEVGLYSQRPPGKNRVQVYDAVMALPKEYRVVFIAGLLDQNFPKAVSEDPFFKDDERQALNGKTRRLEKRSFRHAGERYFFYMAVTRSRDRLYLSHPMKDRDGRLFLPSPFIEEVRRCFTGLPARAREISGMKSWNAKKQAQRDVAEILFSRNAPVSREEAARKSAASFAAFYRNDLRFQGILEAGRREEGARLRDARIIRRIAEEAKVFSATRLESFITCAFKYFAQGSLRLKPSFENRMRLEMGTLLHAVLERFYKGLTVDQKKDVGFWKKTAAVEQALSRDLERLFPESPLAHEPLYRRKYLLARLKQTLSLFARGESEYAQERGLVPTYFELEFGRKLGGKPAEWPFLKLGEGNIAVEGKIDRVDVSRSGKGAFVIDYKLGQRDLKKKIEKGLEVQLPVYLLAVKRLLGLEALGAQLRFLESGKVKELEVERLEGFLSETEERVSEAVGRIKKGDIAVRSKSCDFCDLESVCRFEKWRLIYSEVDERG